MCDTIFVSSWSILSVDKDGIDVTSEEDELDVTYDEIILGRSSAGGDKGPCKFDIGPLPRVEIGSSDSIKASITTISR